MQIAMVAADFTAGEADGLRRAMAAWKKRGGLEPFEQRLKQGMQRNGYDPAFAERVYQQLRGFGEYGFPQSHAASFALLTYVSAWLKCHEPAAFACALLNSQPLGFYAPSQIVQDAARHGVEVRPVDVRYSDWDCTLEKKVSGLFSDPAAQAAGTGRGEKINLTPFSLRLGLRLVKGLGQAAAERIAAARAQQPFAALDDMVARAALDRAEVTALAAADALRAFAANRYQAHWQAAGVEHALPVFERPRFNEAAPLLGRPTEAEDVIADYAASGLSLRRHPLALLRARLDALGVRRAEELPGAGLESGGEVRVAGLVICRQRPDTASGVLFVTLEDETGVANLIVWPQVVESERSVLLNSGLILVSGTLQRQDGVTHVIARRAEDCSDWLEGIEVQSRNFADGMRVSRQPRDSDH